MRRRPALLSSSRTSDLDLAPAATWSALTAAGGRIRWYVDAAPFVARGAIDRVVGGAGRRWPVPTRAQLVEGDLAGFWHVRTLDRAARVLVLEADVRSPAAVVLTSSVAEGRRGTRLTQRVEVRPRGLLGAAYVVVDLPAREAVIELAHRRTVAEVLTASS
jgi:hypothetical protein